MKNTAQGQGKQGAAGRQAWLEASNHTGNQGAVTSQQLTLSKSNCTASP
jgi:hypothetical protein